MAERPTTEEARLEALRLFEILDTPAEEAFDDLARLAAHQCGTPMAAVALVDADRIWAKATVGLEPGELPREGSFAESAIRCPRITIVHDALADPRFAWHELVVQEPNVRFYAGVALVSQEGFVLGTLCVMDREPRSLSADEAAGLVVLGRQAMTLLEHRRSVAELRRSIEERHRAEEVARERDEELRLAAEQMPGILWTTDRELRFTSIVGGGLSAIGLSPEGVVGVTLYEHLGTTEDDFMPIAAHLDALKGSARAYEQNWNGRRFECRVEPMRGEGGAMAGVLGVAVDITDRVWAEGALEETERKFQGLIEAVPAVTYIDPVDEWGESMYVSPQILDLIGVTQEQWLTDPYVWRHHVHPDDIDRVWDEYVQHRETGEPLDHEYRMIHEDGRIVWVHESAVALREAKGKVWLTEGVMMDITERKRVEHELELAWQREREAAEHLRRLDELKNLQLHAVSHDLRGPITAVLGSAVILESEGADVSPEVRRDLVGGIVSSVRKLHRLVTDLLDLDRLERGIVEPNRKPTDVGELARRVVAELRLEGRSVEVSADGVQASVDPVQLERIVENLVLNAAKHTPRGTPIWIRARAEGDGVLVTVEDTGPGVPEELRSVIFEPFRQGAGGPGLGIGLSLVARFAELHGGWARVGDREGGGASFRVFLPGSVPAAGSAAGGAVAAGSEAS